MCTGYGTETDPTTPTLSLLGLLGGGSNLEDEFWLGLITDLWRNPTLGLLPFPPQATPSALNIVPIVCVSGSLICRPRAEKEAPQGGWAAQRSPGTCAPRQRGPSSADSVGWASNWHLIFLQRGEREELNQPKCPQEGEKRDPTI